MCHNSDRALSFHPSMIIWQARMTKKVERVSRLVPNDFYHAATVIGIPVR